ncbi:hypothetical protein BN8_01638 [Fibrisoma limi BUZ 3]|uniref:Uncharacterized protein n=1 Tax=Fibrisoma limi BUZ 3 TaxID=1185876 RepID=I2GFE9_9BACT|nr:hypothetical protein [Fibrisoma limi]CCH52624.1 hypothetical protein BN8_01638 [Fibrisoma limi BUZ 3]
MNSTSSTPTEPENKPDTEPESDVGNMALTALEGGLLHSDAEPAGTNVDQSPEEANAQTSSNLTGTDRDQTGADETMATDS